MIEYAKYFDTNKTMFFRVIDKKMLKKYTKKWGKISSLMKKEFHSEPVYGDSDKYIKTKIKSYRDKTNTNFQGTKILKENTSCKCLSLIIVHSFIKMGKKFPLLKWAKNIIPKHFWKNVNMR